MKVVVLGGGSTGEHFAGALRRLDGKAEMTLVESRLVGGECSYYACMPTKTMLRAAELSSSLDRAPGLAPERPEADGVWAWRDWVTSDWDDPDQLDWLEGRAARSSAARRASPGRRRRGRRDRSSRTTARRRNRLARRDPGGRRSRPGRLLDERRGDVDARDPCEPRRDGRRPRRCRARQFSRGSARV